MADKNTKKYIEGVGRRKTATARVRIYPDSKEKSFAVNDNKLEEHFPLSGQRKTAVSPFDVLKEKFEATAQVKGGGLNSQAEAISHGLARALVEYSEDFKKDLKAYNLLTRDPRAKESKKPGLKRARRAKQWRKR